MTTLHGIGPFTNASLASSISIHDLKSVLSLGRDIVTQVLGSVVIYLVIRFVEHGLEAHSLCSKKFTKNGGWQHRDSWRWACNEAASEPYDYDRWLFGGASREKTAPIGTIRCQPDEQQ